MTLGMYVLDTNKYDLSVVLVITQSASASKECVNYVESPGGQND